jgi:CheY-like chemotaxis protein
MATVLVVDDDNDIRAMCVRALSHIVDVEEARDGLEALELLATRKYDFVLLDLHMPGINGLTVLKALSRDAGPNGHTPICVVSADASSSARECAARAHACYFLTKPVRIAALMALVSDSLHKTLGPAPSAARHAP